MKILSIKHVTLLLVTLFTFTLGYAQVGIGTTDIDASAVLELDATDKALLLPRVANTAAISTPVNGMLIFDISSLCIKAYQNNVWTACLGQVPLTPSETVLAQIGNEGDNPDTVNSVVTVAQLNTILPALTGVDAGNETAYQDYIDANPDLFSSPATVEEVNAMIAAVNNEADAEAGENGAVSTLVKLGTEADPPNESTPTTVTAAELAAVSGVTGVDGDNEAAYQAYINENPDLFSSPATVAEVNAMIAAVNNEADAEAGENGAVSTLVKLGTEADPPNETTPTTVTAAELAAVSGVTGVEGDNEAAYQAYIDANPDLFSSPATVEEVNAMIAAVNNEADAEAGENGAVSTLEKLGTEADPPNESTPTTVTAAELAAVSGVTGVDGDNEAAYQAYINNNPDLFSSPATVAEVNAMIAAVNANEETGGEDSILVQIGTEADAGTGTPSTVTAAQLAALTGITGVDPDNEAYYQQYIADNPDAFSQPATLAEVQAMVNAAAGPTPVYCTGSATTVVDVAGQNGTIWMDRNLGATQQATSSTDTAAYGDLYQWGRFTDGHQCRTSATTSSQSTTSTPAHGDFIFGSTDWLTSQDDTLWQAGSNDPCPSGYRTPTETELNNERLAFSENTSVGAINSALKLPVAGNRSYSNGTLGSVGSYGGYWSSTVSGPNARGLDFLSSTANMFSNHRANGYSVRCIKE